MKVIGREAGERWKAMSSEEKEPYELLSTDSKAEYARLKQLTPAERIMVLAAQAMHHPVRCMCALQQTIINSNITINNVAQPTTASIRFSKRFR